MDPERSYAVLQQLTTPLIAVTSRDGNRSNGMIANSGIRASLVPEAPRVSFYCFKDHFTHELISETGWFGLHLLGRDQFDLVYQLGFQSGRTVDKLSDRSTHPSPNKNLPLLSEAPVAMECEVLNAMDAGPSTFFLGEVRSLEAPDPLPSQEELMTSQHWHENMPEEWEEEYDQNKKTVLDRARGNLDVDPSKNWTEHS